MKLLRTAPLLAVIALASSCGGGDTPDSFDAPSFSVQILDGYVTSDGFRDTVNLVRVGDQEHVSPIRATRGFLSFNMPVLPIGAEIQSVVLRVYQLIAVGDPFPVLGNVVVDQVDYGVVLDASAYAMPAVSSNVGMLTNSPEEGFRAIDITQRFISHMATGATRMQFRLRFTMMDADGDNLEDSVHFEDGDDTQGTGNVPSIIVNYKLP